MTAVQPPPRVVWSMDFELRWGLHDRLGLDFDAYRANLEGARQAVPELLGLFVQRGVRATWGEMTTRVAPAAVISGRACSRASSSALQYGHQRPR